MTKISCQCKLRILMTLAEPKSAIQLSGDIYNNPPIGTEEGHEVEEIKELVKMGALKVVLTLASTTTLKLTPTGRTFIERAMMLASGSLSYELRTPLALASLDELTPEYVAKARMQYEADKANFEEMGEEDNSSAGPGQHIIPPTSFLKGEA